MLFPKLAGRTVGYVNLDTEARLWVKEKGLQTETNPLINPETCQSMVDDVHKKYGLDYSYGGWFEDNVFSEAQLADLRARATRIKADPEAFIAKAKENLSKSR